MPKDSVEPSKVCLLTHELKYVSTNYAGDDNVHGNMKNNKSGPHHSSIKQTKSCTRNSTKRQRNELSGPSKSRLSMETKKDDSITVGVYKGGYTATQVSGSGTQHQPKVIGKAFSSSHVHSLKQPLSSLHL